MSELSTTGETVEAPLSFAQRALNSDAFKALFKEGIALVEETAAYLDGEGRAESRRLERQAALAYASESMRLTTRLMQMTSWLLLQRAVNEGELTLAEAAEEHRKVNIRASETPSVEESFALVPESLQALIGRADRLQTRILRLDAMAAGAAERPAPANGVGAQIERLQAAFGGRR
jgi:regulator of CtrA degradation